MLRKVSAEKHNDLLPGLQLAADRAIALLNESRAALGLGPVKLLEPGPRIPTKEEREARARIRRRIMTREEKRKKEFDLWADRWEKLDKAPPSTEPFRKTLVKGRKQK